ncbi:MAG: hypothetical protein Q7K34_04725 [archaeon]|nr:hypothetical protein [archaeon]
MIVTFIGNDGSGKTTIAKEIESFFRKYGFPVEYRHEYDYFILKYVLRLINKKSLQKKREEFLVHKKKGMIFYLWIILVWIDTTLGYFYLTFIKRDKIFILDRYAYDQLMSFEYLGYENKILRWLFLHVPKPDIVCFLWVEPKTAFDRKKDTHNYGLEFYTSQLDRYFQLVRELKIDKINTGEDIKATSKKVLIQLFSHPKVLQTFVDRCSKNRVMYLAIKQDNLTFLHQSFKELEKIFDNKYKKYIKTIEFISEVLNSKKIDWILLKSWRNFYFLPENDIDILIPEEKANLVLKAFEEKRATISSTEPYKYNVIIKGLMKIEPHTTVTWRDNKFIDNDLLWKFNYVTIGKIQVKISKYDTIVVLLAALWENSFFRLADYLYLKENLWTDSKTIEKQTKKYGWEKSFNWFESNVNSIYVFPAFIPFNKLFDYYVQSIIEKSQKNILTINQLVVFFRDILFFFLWRVRYKVFGILPFHIKVIYVSDKQFKVKY